MGTASSFPTKENAEEQKQTHRSLKGEFEKEFGKTFHEDDISAENDPQSSKSQAVINPAVFRAKRLFMKTISEQKMKETNYVVKKQVCIFNFSV